MWDKYRKGDISHHPNIQTLERVHWRSRSSQLTIKFVQRSRNVSSLVSVCRFWDNLNTTKMIQKSWFVRQSSSSFSSTSFECWFWRCFSLAWSFNAFKSLPQRRWTYFVLKDVQSWFFVWLESFMHQCLTASRFLLPSSCRNLFLEGTAPKMGMYSESYDILTVQCLRK